MSTHNLTVQLAAHTLQLTSHNLKEQSAIHIDVNSSSKKAVGTHYLKGQLATHIYVNSSSKKALGTYYLTGQLCSNPNSSQLII